MPVTFEVVTIGMIIPIYTTETPTAHVNHGSHILQYLLFTVLGSRLLVKGESYVYGTCYCTTHHWVVADTEEAHHLYVCRH